MLESEKNIETTETLKLLFDEFRYRHDLVWRLYFRAVFSVLVLMATPILYIEQLSQSMPNRNLALIFPGVAIIVTLISSWILFVEVRVMRGVMRTYRSILTEALPSNLKETYGVSSRNIGETIIWTFFIASVAMSALEIYLLQLRG